MKFNIQPDSHANITFNGDVRVSIKGEFPYLVKWFCDEVFIGEMFLNGADISPFVTSPDLLV